LAFDSSFEANLAIVPQSYQDTSKAKHFFLFQFETRESYDFIWQGNQHLEIDFHGSTTK
jgi:hypothetical protein